MAGRDENEARAQTPDSQMGANPEISKTEGRLVDDVFRMLLESSSLGTPAARQIRDMTASDEADKILGEQAIFLPSRAYDPSCPAADDPADSGSPADAADAADAAGDNAPFGDGPARWPVPAMTADGAVDERLGELVGRRNGMTLVVSFRGEGPLADRYGLLKMISDAMSASQHLRWYWTALNDADAFLLPIAIPDLSLVGEFVKRLEQRVAGYNRGRQRWSQIKVTLHAGMAVLGFEANSPAPIFTRRLLGAKAVEDALERSPRSGLALILPDWIFRSIQESRNDIGMHPRMFRQADLPELGTVAWIYVCAPNGEEDDPNGLRHSHGQGQIHELDPPVDTPSNPPAAEALTPSGMFIMCVDSLDARESFPQRSWAAVIYALQAAAFATGVALQEPRCFERNGYAVFAIPDLPQWKAASILPAVATRLQTSSAHTLPVRAGWVNMPDGAGSDLFADLALLAEPGDFRPRGWGDRRPTRTRLAKLFSERVLQCETPLLMAVEVRFNDTRPCSNPAAASAAQANDPSAIYALIHQALAATVRVWNPTSFETADGTLVVVQAPIWHGSELHELVEDLKELLGRFNYGREAADRVSITLAVHGTTRSGHSGLPNHQLMRLTELVELARAHRTSPAGMAVIASGPIHAELQAWPTFASASPVTGNSPPEAWLTDLPILVHHGDSNGQLTASVDSANPQTPNGLHHKGPWFPGRRCERPEPTAVAGPQRQQAQPLNTGNMAATSSDFSERPTRSRLSFRIPLEPRRTRVRRSDADVPRHPNGSHSAAPDHLSGPPQAPSRATESTLEQPRIAIWGGAGSGKTTFVAAFGVATARSNQEGSSNAWKVVGTNAEAADLLWSGAHLLTERREFPSTASSVRALSWEVSQGKPAAPSRRAGNRAPTMDLKFRLNLVEHPPEHRRQHDPDAGPLWGIELGETGLHHISPLVQQLADCDGIVYLFDPVQDAGHSDGFEDLLAQLAEQKQRHGDSASRFLPQSLAVCVTKIDERDVYRLAERQGHPPPGEDGSDEASPRQDIAERLFRELCSRSDKGRDLLEGITTLFAPGYVRYFLTSAVGFFEGDSRSPDPRNVVPDRTGKSRLRGAIHPINVIEPLQWLGKQVNRATDIHHTF